ncbi:class I SAM-dependent methyltransferase [Breoghania sp. L-A4]|uniref:class I SAM-dependent methyltransferase n=1 Tax=Breoghania sp. L-A4 TaxID=2304600 RepID=UPI0020BF3694|nr:class I SAM-dependent methyltransferase [Breoghania sp. L-A4]
MSDIRDEPGFSDRRTEALRRLDELTGAKGGDPEDRRSWFEQVYELADDDPAAVPWADLKPKDVLVAWLARNPGAGRRALDVACGLGDNAEALSAAGWATTAFDLADGAIQWARRRFPDTKVDYQVADLFNPPQEWIGAFDLVHECYTLQALHGDLRERGFAAIANLVAPGGTLLVITRSGEDGVGYDGPPWPLTPSELDRFRDLGFALRSHRAYDVHRPDGRVIEHVMAEFRKK